MDKIKIVLGTWLLVIAVLSFSVKSQPDINVGTPLNTKAPELSVLDHLKKPQKMKTLSGDKGLILVFFRSADWCPYCKKHLIEINQWQEKLTKLGYQIAAVSYDKPEILADFKEQHKIEFSLLSDQDHQTMKAFDILNKKYQPADKHYGIPYPGVMVISPDRKVTYKYFYEGYKDRVNLEQLYKDLKAE